AVDAMIAQGVTGPILKLLQDMLQTDRLLVTDGMRFSETIEQNVGAPQGDNISPVLFNTVTSDVVSVVRDLASLKLVIYADDIVAFSSIKYELQMAMTLLEEYFKRKKLEINATKTKRVKFRRGGRLCASH